MPRPVLPGDAMRAEARRVYGDDPDGYEAGRPDYPERVYDLLRLPCGLVPGATVVEIGPGTGRVTRRLLAMGARVIATEPDPALADRLRVSMGSDRLQVIEGTFEDADLGAVRADLIVAAMSFHWVDQTAGMPKVGRLLRPGGWAAVWWSLFGDPTRPDPFLDATAGLLARPGAPSGVPPFELDIAGWTAALERDAGLADVAAELMPWTARFGTGRLRAFHASSILIRRHPVQEQERILDRLVAVAERDFGGVVERPFVTAFYAGRRP